MPAQFGAAVARGTGTVAPMDTIVRVMRPDEFEAMRELSVAAFGDDAQIRLLLNLLHDSWAWEHDL